MTGKTASKITLGQRVILVRDLFAILAQAHACSKPTDYHRLVFFCSWCGLDFSLLLPSSLIFE